jgi:serine/threonine protein kinase
MKMCLILSIIFSSALCWTPDEKEEIITRLKKESVKYSISKPQINIISKILDHAYFGDRYSNFRRVLGAGDFGIIFEVDFQLLPGHPQTIPVALKINYAKANLETGKLIENYLNLMVDANDKFKNYVGEDLLVFNLSRHYEKMLNHDPSFKNDVPFISMIYEAAIISLKDMEDDSGTTKFVNITVTQLGFSDLPGTFLPIPGASTEVMNQNSVNVSKMVVQFFYGLLRIHESGFIHSDIHFRNILVSGNPDNFYAMIIDLDGLKNLNDIISSAFPITKEMLNTSNPNYSRNLLFAQNPNYFIATDDTLIYFKRVKVRSSSFLTSEWQEKLSNSSFVYVANVTYISETDDLLHALEIILNEYIEKNLIDKNHENIKRLKEQIDLIQKKIYKKDFFTTQEVFEQLNEASGLNLTEFHSVNENLESYLEEIRSSRTSKSNSQVSRKREELNVGNDERFILV